MLNNTHARVFQGYNGTQGDKGDRGVPGLVTGIQYPHMCVRTL